MSKKKALRDLKRRRMAAGEGYTMHLLDIWFAGGDIPGASHGVSRYYARRSHTPRAAVRP